MNVSVGRIRDFLIKDETKQSDIEHEDIPEIAVKVQDVDFGWTTNEAILKKYDNMITNKVNKFLIIILFLFEVLHSKHPKEN